jgi:TonB family protein
MTSSKLPLALSAAAFIGGTAFVGLQERALARDADRIADLAEQNRAIPALVTQNKNLALSALDARSLREDAASVGILQRQVDDLEAKAAEGAATSVAPAPTTPASAVNPSNGAGAFDITKLDQRPKMLSQGRPLPPQGIPGDMSGRVLVDFIVGTDGLVYNPVAIDSSNRAFDESAVQAVSQWVFSPGQLAGQNVNVHMQVPIVFSASPEPVAPSAATWF